MIMVCGKRKPWWDVETTAWRRGYIVGDFPEKHSNTVRLFVNREFTWRTHPSLHLSKKRHRVEVN
jgi:hypothetical protein